MLRPRQGEAVLADVAQMVGSAARGRAPAVAEMGVAHDLEVAGVGDHLELEKADLDLELVLEVARAHDHRFVVHGLLLIEQ